MKVLVGPGSEPNRTDFVSGDFDPRRLEYRRIRALLGLVDHLPVRMLLVPSIELRLRDETGGALRAPSVADSLPSSVRELRAGAGVEKQIEHLAVDLHRHTREVVTAAAILLALEP